MCCRCSAVLKRFARNPQGLVPLLEIDGLRLMQSLAVIEYLHATRTGFGLLPSDHAGSARAGACLRDLRRYPSGLQARSGQLFDGHDRRRRRSTRRVDAEIHRRGLADLCLVPHLYSARRWDAHIGALRRVNAIAERCAGLPPFQTAASQS